MSLFAALVGPNGESPQVCECHVNYWILPGLFSDPFFLDVGLHIRNSTERSLRGLSVALPCGSYGKGLEDLSALLKDGDTLALIFGQEVSLQNSSIDWGRGAVEVMSVSVPDSKLNAQWSTDSFSVWDLQLSRDLAPKASAYLRVRIAVVGNGRTWTWKRALGAKVGARLDFRVADTREAVGLPDRSAFAERVLQIESLFVFVMVPGWLEPVLVSPDPKYVRILESSAWERYLDRGRFGRSPQHIIFYWKASTVTTQKGFQGFLDLRSSVPVDRLANHLRLAATVLLMLWTVSLAGPGGPLAPIVDWIGISFDKLLGLITLGGAIGWVARLPKIWGRIAPKLTKAEAFLLKVKF